MPLVQQSRETIIHSGLRQSTVKTYGSAQKRYVEFCHRLRVNTNSEDSMLMYIAHLNDKGLKVSTIKVYLAAVRSYHIVNGYGNIMEGCYRLQQAVRALELKADPPKQKLPITIDILNRVRQMASSDYDSMMFLAAMCLGFYGCLRCAEFTVVDTFSFNRNKHLCRSDIDFMVLNDINVMRVHIKNSKTDHNNVGFSVYVSCTCPHACAYCSMRAYLSRAQPTSTPFAVPLFLNDSGQILTKCAFVSRLQALLGQLGLDTQRYSGHSLRAGCATSAAAAGLGDWEIKMMGRWTSQSYLKYIRLHPLHVVSLMQKLVQSKT